MRELNMLRPSKSRTGRRPEPVVARSSHWVRAEQSGILRAAKPLGARVAKDEVLGWIADPVGENELPVTAPAAGVVIGKLNLPLVNEGEALYHIARFSQTGTAAEVVEQFQEEVGPESDESAPADPPISA
jgi:predicted deacylase